MDVSSPITRARRRARARGLSLLEVLVALGILALISSLIYGAFDGMQKSSKGLTEINDRYHQGRGATSRLVRELSSAFLSMHLPLVVSQAVSATAFVGKDSNPDRVDFTSFSHVRFAKNAHESDQNELGYFVSNDPDVPGKVDLVRRESKYIDLEPTKGGIVNVLAEDIHSFNLEYLDALTGQWTESWDSTQAAGQFNRLPAQVKIVLEMKPSNAYLPPIRFVTRTSIPVQTALNFAHARPSP
jgi:general secretion pathway protein J